MTGSDARHETLASIAAAYGGFTETTLRIPEEKLTAPMHGEWSTRDLMAHISSWEELTALDMHRIACGHLPFLAALRPSNTNDWNHFLMEGRKLFPTAQVYDELESRYDILVEALEAVPAAMFEGSLVTNLLAMCVIHYRDHANHIREWRRKEGI